MKTKQDIVDELKKKINDIENGSMIPFMSFEQGAYSAHNKDLKLIEQLDEPQHDTTRKIPQIIAKYLELCKSDNFDFTEDYNLVSYDFINHFDTDLTIEEMEEIKMWFYDNDQKENQRRHILFLQAYTYGYEVEEEPKWYMVRLNNGEGYIFDITRSWTYKKLFETKNEADAWAELHDGTVEEVPNEL